MNLKSRLCFFRERALDFFSNQPKYFSVTIAAQRLPTDLDNPLCDNFMLPTASGFCRKPSGQIMFASDFFPDHHKHKQPNKEKRATERGGGKKGRVGWESRGGKGGGEEAGERWEKEAGNDKEGAGAGV